MRKEEIKLCKECLRRFPVTAFARDSRRGDGYRRTCRRCDAERRKRATRSPFHVMREKVINKIHESDGALAVYFDLGGHLATTAPGTKSWRQLTRGSTQMPLVGVFTKEIAREDLLEAIDYTAREAGIL